MFSDKKEGVNKKEEFDPKTGTLFSRLIEFAKQIQCFNDLSRDDLIYLRCIGEHPLDDYIRIVQDENQYDRIMTNGSDHYERTTTRRGLCDHALHIIVCYFLVNGFAERIMIATFSNDAKLQYRRIVESLKSIGIEIQSTTQNGNISVDTPIKRLENGVDPEITRKKHENRVFWVSPTSDSMRGSTPTIGIYIYPSERVQENMKAIKEYSRIHLVFLYDSSMFL